MDKGEGIMGIKMLILVDLTIRELAVATYGWDKLLIFAKLFGRRPERRCLPRAAVGALGARDGVYRWPGAEAAEMRADCTAPRRRRRRQAA